MQSGFSEADSVRSFASPHNRRSLGQVYIYNRVDLQAHYYSGIV